jgi:DNA-binding XRE family transcriptional regulator
MSNNPVIQDAVRALDSLAKNTDKSFEPVRDSKQIGDTLRQARLSLNLTQGDMARLLGIPLSRWSSIENAIPVRVDTPSSAGSLPNEPCESECDRDEAGENEQLRAFITDLPRITAGMKLDCMGQFSWQEESPYYDESGNVIEHTATRTVPWDLCKDIYKAMMQAKLRQQGKDTKP